MGGWGLVGCGEVGATLMREFRYHGDPVRRCSVSGMRGYAHANG